MILRPLHHPLRALVLVTGGILAAACSGGDATETSTAPAAPTAAVATIQPTGNTYAVTGTARFEEISADETRVTITIDRGVPGAHGLHIHELGSCDSGSLGPAFGAGDHWNPEHAAHGLPTSAAHHLGDLGNITIDNNGHGEVSLTLKGAYVHDGPLSVLHHAITYNVTVDDGATQPNGNSGARPGCGVIALP